MIDIALLSKDTPPATHVFKPILPAALTILDLKDALRTVIAQYEALRTIFRIGDGHQPCQAVLRIEEPVVSELQNSTDDTTLRRAAIEAIDLSHGPVIAAAVTTREGSRVIDAVVAVARITVDGAGLSKVKTTINDALASSIHSIHSKPEWHPLDQAQWQSNDAGIRLDTRAQAHLGEVFSNAPHSTLPFVWTPRTADAVSAETRLTSSSLLWRAQKAATSFQTSVSTIFLSLVATVISAWTGHESLVIDGVTSNRGMPQLRSSVGHYVTWLPMHFNLPGDLRFSEFVRRCQMSVLASQRFGLYNTGEARMEAVRRSVPRGAMFTNAVFFNYHDYMISNDDVSRIAADTGPIVFHRRDLKRTQTLNIDVFPRGDTVSIQLIAPYTLLSEHGARQFIDAIPHLLDAALASEGARLSDLTKLVEVPAQWCGPRWISANHSWISLDGIDELLTQAGAIEAAATFAAESDPDRAPSLVSYVASSDPLVTAEILRDRLRGLVSHAPSTRMPDRIEVRRVAPDDITDQDAWHAAPTPPTSRQKIRITESVERAGMLLAEAFSTVHPGQSWQGLDSYAEAGGAYLRIPAVLECLMDLGCTGIRFFDLTSMGTKRYFAEKTILDTDK